jgi:hypothetical protein
VPLGHSDEALARRVKPAENLPETVNPMRREVKRHGSGVNVPAQDALVGHPTSVALEHLFRRRWFLAMNGIGRLQGTKDVVNEVKRRAHDMLLLELYLRQQEKVIDININGSNWVAVLTYSLSRNGSTENRGHSKRDLEIGRRGECFWLGAALSLQVPNFSTSGCTVVPG